jgi:PST family polysaccharide transporter
MNCSILGKNICALFILQLANYALPLITLPYLLRVLGPENFGRIAFAQAFIQYFAVLTDYGFNFSATRTVAQIRDNKQALSHFVCTVTVIKTGLMSIGFLIMLTMLWFVPVWRDDWELYVIVYISILGSVLFPVWLLQGLESMRHITILSISARALMVCAIFVFIRQPNDYRLAAAIFSLSGVTSGLLALMILPRFISLRWHWPSSEEVYCAATDGWHLFISNIAINLYTSSNIFFLGLLTNTTTVGYFATAEKLIKAVHGLVGPISQAAYPHIAAITVNSKTSAIKFISKLLKFQGSFTLIISISVFFLAKPTIYLLFGENYQPSVILVQWMATLPFVIGLSNVLGIHTMLNFGMKTQFSNVLILGGLINIALIFTLVPKLGGQGAAISVLLSETAVTTLMAAALARRGLLTKILGI